MTELLLRGPAADELIARRRELGIDTYDEMWDGVYHVTPVGSAEHADLQAGLIGLLRASHRPGTIGLGPINLGDERNYRVPDAAVIDVVHRNLVWVPSALLVGEVLSVDDDTYEKFDHYEAHGVQEILVVDPSRECVEIWVPSEGGGYEQGRRSLLLGGRTAEVIWAQIG